MHVPARKIFQDKRFGFGRNWKKFLEVLNDERVFEAKQSLCRMLACDELNGKSFLDIGSGSGLFSLAARMLGANVYSFDYDQDSVACTSELRRRYFPLDEGWKIAEGSVLNTEFMKSLGEFDIVYSWGVLHHTGDLWRALNYARLPLKNGGLLFIAVYNDQGARSALWKKVKQVYCSGTVGQALMLALFVPVFIAGGFIKDVVHLRNPLARYYNYRKNRGMSVVHDWMDWLGGYPFEVSRPDEIIDFYGSRGLHLIKLTTTRGWGNNEFVFKKDIPVRLQA